MPPFTGEATFLFPVTPHSSEGPSVIRVFLRGSTSWGESQNPRGFAAIRGHSYWCPLQGKPGKCHPSAHEAHAVLCFCHCCHIVWLLEVRGPEMRSRLGSLEKLLVIKAQTIAGPVAVLLGLRNGDMKALSPLVTFIMSC